MTYLLLLFIIDILIFVRLDCFYSRHAARKRWFICHRTISLSLVHSLRELFYEDILAASRRMFTIITRMAGKMFRIPGGYAHTLHSLCLSLSLSFFQRTVSGRRVSLRAHLVESRSIREERKIGAPLPRDKRNLWPCLHGAPRLKLIRPS